MTCPSCESETLGGALYCGFCASPLPVVCPACEEENPADARFCASCGKPLGERRAVVPVREPALAVRVESPNGTAQAPIDLGHADTAVALQDAPAATSAAVEDTPAEMLEAVDDARGHAQVAVDGAPAEVVVVESDDAPVEWDGLSDDPVADANMQESDPPQPVDPLEVAASMEREGDRAADENAHEVAILHYEDALRQLNQESGGRCDIARVDEKLGAALSDVGRYDDALEHLQRAADTARAERDVHSLGRITVRMASVHHSRETPEEGIALVTPMLVSPVIDLLTWSGPSETVAALHLALADLAFLAGRHRETLASAERAAEVAVAVGNNRLLGEAEAKRIDAIVALGQVEKARLLLDTALPPIEAAEDPVLLARALTTAAGVAKRAGDMEAGRRFAERAVDAAERLDNRDQLMTNLINLAEILLVLGEWDAAQEAIGRAGSMLADSESELAVSTLLLCGQLLLWRGNWAEAEQRLQEAADVAARTDDRAAIEVAQTLRAEIRVRLGRHGEVVAALQAFAEGPDANLGLVLPVLAWALLESGDAEGALDRARQAVDSAWAQQPVYLVDALRTQGRAMHELGRSVGASMILEDALTRARAMPYPYAEARILAEMGRSQEALAIFKNLGAVKDIERVEREAATAK